MGHDDSDWKYEARPGSQEPAPILIKQHRPETFEEACRAIFERQLALMMKKRQDYGTQNILLTGEIGVAVRSQDKLARIMNLLKKGEEAAAVSESLDDTWGDLMNYALIALTLRNGTYELPASRPKLHYPPGVRSADDLSDLKPPFR